jgi:hypothetical protein
MEKLYYFILLFFLISCGKTANFSPSDKYFVQTTTTKISIFPGDPSLYGYVSSSNLSMEDAETKAIKLCEEEKKSDLPCRVVFRRIDGMSEKGYELAQERKKLEQENQKIRVEKEKKQVKENLERFISQCEYIGFKRNTEKMGECVLKISQTEKQIVNTQSNNSSGDTLANLIILQESLKLLNPPASPRRNVQCTYNTVGSILGVNCF